MYFLATVANLTKDVQRVINASCESCDIRMNCCFTNTLLVVLDTCPILNCDWSSPSDLFMFCLIRSFCSDHSESPLHDVPC